MNISPVILTLIALAAVVILVVTALSKKKIVASSFTKKPLMNKAEIRLFRMLQEELPSNWTVLCQVAYGGFLANRNFGKFMSMKDYVSTARLDRSEPIENDELAQAEVASDFAEALDDTLHDYANKLEKLRTIDFGPKLAVNEGAVVKLSGRHFVIAVSTSKFTCQGRELMGISTMAPIFEAIEGARAGETVQFNGRDLTVEDVE